MVSKKMKKFLLLMHDVAKVYIIAILFVVLAVSYLIPQKLKPV